MAAVGLLLLTAGCFSVDVPEGPYMTTDVGSGNCGGQVRDFLEDAHKDRVISDTQYRDLLRRADNRYPRK